MGIPSDNSKTVIKKKKNEKQKEEEMIDLKNLSDELKYGKVLEEGKYLTLLTPLARLSFCDSLATPEQFKGEGKFRHSIDMIFEMKPGLDGSVDFKKLMLPAIIAHAKREGVDVQKVDGGIALGKSQQHPYVAIHTGKRFSEEGTEYAGYTDSCVWVKASKTPKVQAPPWEPIPCVSPTGKPGFPSVEIYGGCWGRCIIQAYKPKGWPMMTFGLNKVQKIADGEAFGSGGLVGEMGGVEGAEEPKSEMETPAGQPAQPNDATGASDDYSQFL